VADYLLIVNPNSGKRNHKRLVAKAVEFFARDGHGLQVAFTNGPGHAMQLTQDALKDSSRRYRAVIAAGGDGTVNEVLNGLVGSRVPMGILPWGTTNVFTIEMGFPRTLHAQCSMIMRGRPRELDVGLCNGRAFLLMAGIGFDAYSLRGMLDLKTTFGPFAYILSGLRSFFRFKAPHLKYTFANGREHEAAYMLVSNTSLYGGIFRFTPKASPIDGKLDVYIFRERGRWRLMKLIISLVFTALGPYNRLRRRFLYLREATIKSDSLHIEADRPAYVQLDGDFAGSLPVDIRLRALAARVIIPRRAARRLDETD